MPSVKRLESGYYLVRWSLNEFAQVPPGEVVLPEHIFHHNGYHPDDLRRLVVEAQEAIEHWRDDA